MAMTRISHLACCTIMLAIAATAGLAMARWRNQADLAAAVPAPQPAPAFRPSSSSKANDEPGRYAERMTVAMEDAGIAFRTPQPSFSLANNRGEVLNEGLNQAGVSLFQKAEIQAAIDSASERARVSMKERVKVDERNSDHEKNIRAYLIPAKMGLREEILGKLESDFAKICGPEKAALLIQAVHPSGRFGYFGRQSIMVRITPGTADQGKKVDYETFDPISGHEASGGTMTDEESFREAFGDAIEW